MFRRFMMNTASKTFQSAKTNTSTRMTTTTTTATTTTTTRRILKANLKQAQPQPQPLRFLSTTTTTDQASSLLKPKPWGTPVVETLGDYRQEAWLERHIGGPLYANQDVLPKLPVPTIEDTLQRFVPTALPLCKDDAERKALLRDVEKFPQQATELQQRLLARAADADATQSSWLQHWWNTLGYLDVRDSIMINVSYYFHFTDDSTIYTTSSASEEDPQVKRAAALLWTTARVRNAVVTGTWPAELVGKQKTPLCSVAYKYMFHATRIPQSPRDAVRMYDPALHTHAAVACRGHLFQIPLVDPETHAPVSLTDLERALQECIETARSPNTPPPTGWTWCTTTNRDTWAAAYAKVPATARDDLQILESAACLVCLDDHVEGHTTDQMAAVLLHGNALHAATAGKDTNTNNTAPPLNRWYDKSLQYVVTRNGKAGFVGEHSMMDGMPVVTLADQLATQSYAACVQQCAQQSTATNVIPVKLLFANKLTASDRQQMQSHVDAARQEYADWVGQHDIAAKRFGVYGANWIKKHAKQSPDAFAQMAMQIATYRLWNGQQGGTYEATQVRPFKHGRTETTRSVSTQSAALVQRFGTQPLWHEVYDATARREKLQLLADACAAHVQYIGLAAAGQGVDRHFLGLLLSASSDLQPNQAELPLPDLYANPVFQRSKTWRVSTSNLSHPSFANWGYGEVTPTGVGLSYSVLPDRLQFSVTALKRPPEYDDDVQDVHWPARLCTHIEEALLELQCLVEAEEQASSDKTTPQSKL